MPAENKLLYKYAPIESAIKIIENNSVILNSPSNFNDPFDSIISVSEKTVKKTIDLIINYFAFVELAKFIRRKDIPLTKSQQVLFATLRAEVKATEFLTRKTMSYTPIPSFTAAFKRLGKRFKELGEKIKEGEAYFKKSVIPTIYKFRDRAKISCFSKRSDSILMWSHYADSHCGACIEFEENRHFFKDVIYSDKRCEFDLYTTVSILLAHGFIEQKVTFKDANYAEKILEPYFHKSKDWKYEEEVRCVLSDNESTLVGYNYDGEKTTLNMKIKRILIGSKASGDKLNQLLCLAKNRDIPVTFMKEDEKYFKIVPDSKKNLN